MPNSKSRKLPRTRQEFESRLCEAHQDGLISGARNNEIQMKFVVEEREKRVRDQENVQNMRAIEAMCDMGKALAQHAEVLGRTVMHLTKRQDR